MRWRVDIHYTHLRLSNTRLAVLKQGSMVVKVLNHSGLPSAARNAAFNPAWRKQLCINRTARAENTPAKPDR